MIPFGDLPGRYRRVTSRLRRWPFGHGVPNSEGVSSVPQAPPAAKVVLVVDDDREVREATTDLLTDMGYLTAAAGSGHAALGLLERGLAPAIMLVDLEMPGMNGDELCARVNALGFSAVPKIFISGSQQPAGLLERTGAAAFFRKPISVAQLQGLLASHDIHPASAQ